VVRLPEVTFKPNKINVRASILYLVRREQPDIDHEAKYDVTFIDIKSLGYHGSGEPIRGFDEKGLMSKIEKYVHGAEKGNDHTADHWRAFSVPISKIIADNTCRLDLKYWDQDVLKTINGLAAHKFPTLGDLATTPSRRGKSPPAEDY